MEKRCMVCNEVRDINSFRKLKSNKDGFSYVCKICLPSCSVVDKLAEVKCSMCGKTRTVKICNSMRDTCCRSCGGKKSNRTMFYETRYDNLKYIENRLINSTYNTIKKNAKKRKLEFLITKNDLKFFLHQQCYYCGSDPANTFTCFRYSSSYKKEILYQGIDRIDSSKGYVLDNIRPCCIHCNHMKWDHKEQDFLEKVRIVYERLVKTRQN